MAIPQSVLRDVDFRYDAVVVTEGKKRKVIYRELGSGDEADLFGATCNKARVTREI